MPVLPPGGRQGPDSPFLFRSAGSFKAVGNGILANTLDCTSTSTCFAVVYPQPEEMHCMTAGCSREFSSLRHRMVAHRGRSFVTSPIDGAHSL